jgi:hypothetical protein
VSAKTFVRVRETFARFTEILHHLVQTNARAAVPKPFRSLTERKKSLPNRKNNRPVHPRLM